MVIDHVGAELFPHLVILRIIGRIAFPIFAYQVTQGYKYTSNIKGYARRLLIMGLISEPFYFLYFQLLNLNIFFTLFLGLFSMYFYERKKFVSLSFLLLLSYLLPMDYGIYGVLTILGFFCVKNKGLVVVVQTALSFGYAYYYHTPIQIWAIVALIFVFMPSLGKLKVNIPKRFFYGFYPMHLLYLLIIKILIVH